jgi:hypothetical protein
MKITLPSIMLCLALLPIAIAQNKTPSQSPVAPEPMCVPTVAEVLTNYVRAIGGTAAWEKLNWTVRFKDIRHNVSIEDSKFERPGSP